MEQEQAFRSARSYYFQSMIHELGSRRIPMNILRIFWSVASEQARAFINNGHWRGPTSLRV